MNMASSSFSGRSVTSFLPSESTEVSCQSSDGEIQSSVDPLNDGIFVPHVYDFVSIIRRANFRGPSQLPPLFLEPLAVDQSIIVGHGASFTTLRRAIPSAHAWSETCELDGYSVTIRSDQDVPPKHVVYKVARVAFTEIGGPTPETRHAMKAVMMELYSLVYEPLQKHPNIINLLGLAWGSNYFDPSNRLPVLVVEFADHGNLSQLQEKEDLPPATRACLALDVGEGLKMLHRCGIIHGDVKSENILIFSHTERKYIAKVSDFGFSMVGEAANAEVFVGGTRPWKAPEAKSRLPKHLLRATDVYSYGLLLWRLATDGQNPFRFWAPYNLRGEAYLRELERIKEEDHLVKNVPLENWFVSYVLEKQRAWQVELTADSIAQTLSKLQIVKASIEADQSKQVLSADVYDALMEGVRCLRPPFPAEALSGALLHWAQRDDFYGRIPSALSKCLSVDPTKRDLNGAIAALRGDSRPNAEPAMDSGDILLRISYDHHTLDWQQMRDLQPAVQSFVFNCFRSKVQNDFSKQKINPPDCFVLASYYINGYGTEVNYEDAKRLLLMSSQEQYRHPPSRAYAYRIFKSLDPDYVPNPAMLSNLSVMAVMGSRMAAADLKDLSPDQYLETASLIRNAAAGVGANFFYGEQMLGGFVYCQWVRTFDNREILVRNLGLLNNIADYKVNKRGDKILHLAASSGRFQAIETLLDAFPVLKVNQLNDQGETPLLCACRAGQVATVLKLLELGSDASIATPSGESCLHWLVSFEDDDVDEIGKALIKARANMRILTRKRIAYSEFRATIDVDFQLQGTPLSWAVHHNRPRIVKLLLDEASDVSICFDWATDSLGPGSSLEYAALYHHVECLELMTDALDQAKIGYTYGPLLRAGAHSADTFSMILRHGPKYKERLHKFFDFCLKKAGNTVFFGSGIGRSGSHLLYSAVSGGRDEVVEYLLSSHVRQLIESFGNEHKEGRSPPGAYNPSDINRPAGEDRRTPVLEAIRWNRKHIVELLVSNGADPKATAKNPFTRKEMNWTGLHILANAGHNKNHSELVSFLVKLDLPVDGTLDGSHYATETPFLVAIQHNAFCLATTFLDFGANLNALCFSSGLITLDHPTTVLGHIVAASSQHTTPRLRYLLSQRSKSNKVDFIVEPARKLSALHRAAWAHKGISHRSPDDPRGRYLSRHEYDMVVNRDIIHELLQEWHAEEHLNLRSDMDGRTALHLAVDAGNVKAVELLLERNTDTAICDDQGLTPVELAQSLFENLTEDSPDQDIYAAIITLLVGGQLA